MAGQLTWGLPALSGVEGSQISADTLRQSVEGVQSGLEEKLNVHLARQRRIEAHLNRLPALSGLTPETKQQLAEAIVGHRPFGGYRSKEDFVRRLSGRVTDVEKRHLEAVTDSLRLGMSRRTALLTIGSGLVAASGLAGLAVWLLQDEGEPPRQKPLETVSTGGPPFGRIVWVMGWHNLPKDLDEVSHQLALSKGGAKAIFIGEKSPQSLMHLEKADPELAKEITWRTLEGVERNENPSLKARLREAWKSYSDSNEEVLRELRAQPKLLSLPRIRQSLGAHLPIIEYLVENKGIEVYWEEPTEELFLELLRRDLAHRDFLDALIKRGDREAAFRAFARFYRYAGRLRNKRDRQFAPLVRSILERRPGTIVVVSRGSSHAQVIEWVGDYQQLRFEKKEIGTETGFPELYHTPLAPYQSRLLEDESLSIPPEDEIRQSILKEFVLAGLMDVLTVLGESRKSQDLQEMAKAVVQTLPDSELEELILALQGHHRFLDQRKELPWQDWFTSIRAYLTAWLLVKGRLAPYVEEELLRRLSEMGFTPERLEEDSRWETPRQSDPATRRSGLEEMKLPNVNSAGEKKLVGYLERLELKLPEGISTPNPSTRRWMAKAILQELHRTKRPFKDAEDFRERMHGKLEGVRNPVWGAVSERLRYGVSRRVFLKWGVAAAGGAAAAAGGAKLFYEWVTKPPGQMILVLGPHGEDVDLEPVLEELRLAEGSSKVVLVDELAPPFLNQLWAAYPEVAQQITKNKLDQLIGLLQTQGEEAVGKDPLGAELKRIAIHNQQTQEPLFARLRANPAPLDDLDKQKEWLGLSNIRLYRYLVQHPEIEIVLEQAPLISCLYSLRRDLAEEEAALAFYRDKNEEGFFRAVAERVRFYEKGIDSRDRVLGMDLLPGVLSKYPGAKVIVRLGSAHLRHQDLAGLLKRTGFQMTLRRNPLRYWPDRILDPYREALMSDPATILPGAIQPVFRRYFTYLSLYYALRTGNLSAEESDRWAKEVVIDSLSEQDFEELSGILRDRFPLFQRLAKEKGIPLDSALGFYAVTWLKQRGKIKPEIQAKLPENIQNATLDQLERELQTESAPEKRRESGLEERQGQLAQVRERWAGLRSGMEEVPFVVFGRSLAEAVPEVQILAGLEERFLADWEPKETVMELMERDAYSVRYFGGLEEAQRFEPVAHRALIETTIHNAGKEPLLLFLERLLGIPPQAVTGGLEELLSDLKTLADA